jgi:hypothetical protein
VTRRRWFIAVRPHALGRRWRFEAVVRDVCACHGEWIVARGRTRKECARRASRLRVCEREGCTHPTRGRFCSHSCAWASKPCRVVAKADRIRWGREGGAATALLRLERLADEFYAEIEGLPHVSPACERSIKAAIFRAYQRGRHTDRQASRAAARREEIAS